MILQFDQRKLPRTMGRAEWREIDRWRRVTQKALREARERDAEALRHACEELGAFGSATLVIAAERLINPPVLIGPYQ